MAVRSDTLEAPMYFVKQIFEREGERDKKALLTTETVQGAALSLEGIDDIERCDSLSLGVLGVGDGVTDDTLEEGLENTTGLLVDHCIIVSRLCFSKRVLVWNILAEIRLTPPRRARRRIAGLVIP
jgi:hypothetical protein